MCRGFVGTLKGRVDCLSCENRWRGLELKKKKKKTEKSTIHTTDKERNCFKPLLEVDGSEHPKKRSERPVSGEGWTLVVLTPPIWNLSSTEN